MRYVLLVVALVVVVGAVPTRADDGAKVKGLVERLGAEAFEDRERAEAALLALGGPALAAVRRASASHPDAEVRKRASRLVARIEQRVRLAALGGDDVPARRAALAALVRTHGVDTVALLASRLGEGDEALEVRVWALTEILFVETDPALRGAAITALGQVGAPRSLRGLVWALVDGAGHGHSPAYKLLKEQADATVLADLEWLAAREVKDAKTLLKELRARLPEADAGKAGAPLIDRAAIVARLAPANAVAERVRAIRMVATGLGMWPEAVDGVAGLFDDGALAVRAAAVGAFRWLPAAPRDEALLQRARRDASRRIRLLAVLALGNAATDRSRAGLLALAQAKDAELARAAISSLGGVGDAGTVAALERLEEGLKDAELKAQIRASLDRIRARLAAQQR